MKVTSCHTQKKSQNLMFLSLWMLSDLGVRAIACQGRRVCLRMTLKVDKSLLDFMESL